MAKQAKSKEVCFRKLQETGTLTVEEEFTDELWNRVHGKMKKVSKSQKRPVSPEKTKAVRRSPSPKKQKVPENDSDSDEWEREEKQRKQDQAEKDEFVERLKKRDEERTKKKGYQQPDYNEGKTNSEIYIHSKFNTFL